jgi:hypothetical protein
MSEYVTWHFSKRADEIIKQIKLRAFSEDWLADATMSWGEARQTAKFRNRIAHSPLFFAWTNAEEIGEPDLIGIADVRKSNPEASALIPIQEMEAAINAIVPLAQKLADLRTSWCDLRDSRSET